MNRINLPTLFILSWLLATASYLSCYEKFSIVHDLPKLAVSSIKPSIGNSFIYFQSSTALYFKKGGNDGNNDKGKKGSAWDGIKRFISGITRAKLDKKYDTPLTSANARYHLRLIRDSYDQGLGSRRHITTRIVRYLPDIQFETAAEIVDEANYKGRALVRVFQSLKDAEYVANMMRIADPPISVEIYDTKEDEVIG